MTDTVPSIAVHVATRAGSVVVMATGSPAILVGVGVGVGVVLIGAGVAAALRHRRGRAGPPVRTAA